MESLQEEEEAVWVQNSWFSDTLEIGKNCLLAKPLTNKPVNLNHMKNVFTSLWHVDNLTIKQVSDKAYIFNFHNPLLKEHVLENQPWYFDKTLMVLKDFDGFTEVKDLDMDMCPFWVQIHGLPLGMMNENVGIVIGESIGHVEYVDRDDDQGEDEAFGKFLRVRVQVHVSKPLRPGLNIVLDDGSERFVAFRYERLPDFCYVCGCLDHVEVECEVARERIRLGVDVNPGYGKWICGSPTTYIHDVKGDMGRKIVVTDDGGVTVSFNPSSSFNPLSMTMIIGGDYPMTFGDNVILNPLDYTVFPAGVVEDNAGSYGTLVQQGAWEIDFGNLTINDNGNANMYLDEPEDSNIKAVTSGDTPYTSAFAFEELNLSPELLKGLYVEMKFERPSKIQAISLPMILNPPYTDLIAQAHNGSGKTTCFTLGMLSRVDPKLKAPQALCICPTRELAIQNMEVLNKMGKHTGITSECAIPMDSSNYIPLYKRPPFTAQVVIGTPGTIKKWMVNKKLGVSFVKILVFDEADHMLAEDGFKDDSLRIMRDIERISSHCQVLLFSATFNELVKKFVSKIVKIDHNQLFVKKEELSLESVKQYKVNVPDELSKIMVIKERIFEFGDRVGQTIIFVRSRNSATMLHRSLVDLGYEVTTIQGALKQEDRDKIVKEFKDGLTQVLISTDLLARGFDQHQINLVINYDLPVRHDCRTEPDCEVYLHRMGRAGRFGRKGAVFNLLCGNMEEILMSKIENHFGTRITDVPDWRNEDDFKAALDSAGLL